MTNNTDIKLLYERFLHLSQYILCNDQAAIQVANKATKIAYEQYDSMSESEVSFIKYSQQILDNEIDKYFQNLLNAIKNNSNNAEQELFTMLFKRFTYLIENKIMNDSIRLDKEDAEDIVQNALKTVHERCKSAQPKGTFIQWAQTVLINKYREHRRSLIKSANRVESLSKDDFEHDYPNRISDVTSRRKTEKEVDPDEVSTKSNRTEKDYFEDDPYTWHPSQLIESKDMKNRLLHIIKKMDKRCKQVFKSLFSEGDVKSIHKKFSNLPRKQVDVIIFRCRQKLKKAALEGSIL